MTLKNRAVLGASLLALAAALVSQPLPVAAENDDRIVTAEALLARKQAAGRERLRLQINPAALPDFVRAQDDPRRTDFFGNDVWVRPDIIIADQLGDPDSILDLTDQHPNVVAVWLFDLDTGIVFGLCSGTLINARTVATAAHCVRMEGTDPSFDSHLGVVITTAADAEAALGAGDYILAAGHVAPEDYDRDAFFLGNDIALIALDERITAIDPAALVDSAPAIGTLATSVGFGTTGLGSDALTQFL